MASAILSSAKHGAYVAIGLYVAMVLVVSLSAQSQRLMQAPIQVAYPAIQFEHAQHVSAGHSDVAGAVGV
ncbi:hypothetical protein HK44_005590 [Pseudomonas fluorescens HK44]|uniref:Uncharacterized protein n=1 Tax=Pseudomonas fluorescens HK44 TaxID=1042209 RepID=A0A010SPZ6_PSEFL|nr:hypothetical protein [Pseudomonas fluorescens]EXF93168.1 hypothetical protein HK44_005590 [Pseudomonas fluorescens HK44]